VISTVISTCIDGINDNNDDNNNSDGSITKISGQNAVEEELVT